MKRVLFLLLVSFCIMQANGQSIYVPATSNAADSIKVPVNVGGAVRTVWNIDLGKNKLNTSGGTVTGNLTAAADLTVSGVLKSTATYNNQTGTSYTLVLTDRGKWVAMNNANSNTVTIPLNASVAFPIGTVINLTSLGVGQTTIVPTTGVTVISADNATKIRTQGSPAQLIKTGTDSWQAIGDIL